MANEKNKKTENDMNGNAHNSAQTGSAYIVNAGGHNTFSNIAIGEGATINNEKKE